MAQEPIKLFAKRSERYPEPEEVDLIHGGARALLSTLPVLGGPLTEVLSILLAPAVSRRRDEWIKELADALDELQQKLEGFRTEDLVQDEAFVSAMIRASRAAIGTHRQDKRRHLRNGLMNIAAGRAADEEWHDILMQLVEDLTPIHIRLLRYFDNPYQFVSREYAAQVNSEFQAHGIARAPSPISEMEKSLPDLGDNRSLYEPVLHDLHARRLLHSPLEIYDDALLPDEHGPFQRRTTPLGSRLIAFISEPDPSQDR